MVDYSRWDKIDTGTDESSGEAVPAPAHQIISPGPRPPGAVRAMDPASIMASIPDDVLVLILANVDHASCHLTRATCGRFRDLNERASVVRVRALSFPQNWRVAKVQRNRTDWSRFEDDDDFDPDDPWTQMWVVPESDMHWHFPSPPQGHKWAGMYLEGTGDEFVISTTDKRGIKSFLRVESPQTTLLQRRLSALTEDQGEASRWTVVETVSYRPRRRGAAATARMFS